ncbi:GNAT family N-acetyltransferase [Aquimarina spongiae]|uniref:Spermine/spermidine N-acetyltransferase n=1 Tax=Aquimarina spongiae TaxID=570521 RepID=A0A1M6AJW7_9FLAO|nr:GNAT family N-acetyltransferase [Aquimarina spongiae]SHI36707.1 spermine/spermidine N-acetyltransferase [Aquimarina spongiae]
MVPQDVEIVKVTLEDKEKLLEIGYNTFYEAFGPPVNTEENIQSYLEQKFTLDQITQELLHPHSQFYFACIQNTLVGYIKLNTQTAQTEAVDLNALEIERIYVTKEQQGKSIGQILLQKALSIAKELQSNCVWLGVWDQNTRAIRFYERWGFKAFTTHKFVLGTEIQTDVMMKLEL